MELCCIYCQDVCNSLVCNRISDAAESQSLRIIRAISEKQGVVSLMSGAFSFLVVHKIMGHLTTRGLLDEMK